MKTLPNRTTMFLLFIFVFVNVISSFAQNIRPKHDTESDWVPVAKPCATCHQDDLVASETRLPRSFFKSLIPSHRQSTKLINLNDTSPGLQSYHRRRAIDTSYADQPISPPYRTIPLANLYDGFNQNFLTQNLVQQQPQPAFIQHQPAFIQQQQQPKATFSIQPSFQLAPNPAPPVNMVHGPGLHFQSQPQPVAAPLIAQPAFIQRFNPANNYRTILQDTPNVNVNVQPSIVLQQPRQQPSIPQRVPTQYQPFNPEQYVSQPHEDFRLLQNFLNNQQQPPTFPLFNTQEFVQFHDVQQSNLSDIVITTPQPPPRSDVQATPQPNVQPQAPTVSTERYQGPTLSNNQQNYQDISTTRRYTSSTPKEDIQLLYVPVEQVNQQQNAPTEAPNTLLNEIDQAQITLQKNRQIKTTQSTYLPVTPTIPPPRFTYAADINEIQQPVRNSAPKSVSSQAILSELGFSTTEKSYVQKPLLRQNALVNQGNYNELSYSTTQKPITQGKKRIKLKPHQPPLAIFMNGDGKPEVSVADLINELIETNKIDILDQVNQEMPQVFIGPANMAPPKGFAKFDLPYLSSLIGKRPQRKVDDLPFFVAPLSYETPKGFYKIDFPAPHVGSVVYRTTKDVQDKNPEAQGDFSRHEALPTPHAQFSTPHVPQKSTPQEFPQRYFPSTSSPVDINAGFHDSLVGPEFFQQPFADPFHNQFTFFPTSGQQQFVPEFFPQFPTPTQNLLPANNGGLDLIQNYTNVLPNNDVRDSENLRDGKEKLRNQQGTTLANRGREPSQNTVRGHSNRDFRPTESIQSFLNLNTQENKQKNAPGVNVQPSSEQGFNVLQQPQQSPTFFPQYTNQIDPKKKVEQIFFEYNPQSVSTTGLPQQYFLPAQSSTQSPLAQVSGAQNNYNNYNPYSQNIDAVKAAVFTPENLKDPIKNGQELTNPAYYNQYQLNNGEQYSSTPNVYKTSFTSAPSFKPSIIPLSTEAPTQQYTSSTYNLPITSQETTSVQYLPERVNSLQSNQPEDPEIITAPTNDGNLSQYNVNSETTTQAVEYTTPKRRRPHIIRPNVKNEPTYASSTESSNNANPNNPEYPTRQRFKTRGRVSAARTTSTTESTGNYPKKVSYINTDFRQNSNRNNAIQNSEENDPEIITADNVGPDAYVHYNVPARPNQINQVRKETTIRPEFTRAAIRSRAKSRYRTTTVKETQESASESYVSPVTESTRRYSEIDGKFGERGNDVYDQSSMELENSVSANGDDRELENFKNTPTESLKSTSPITERTSTFKSSPSVYTSYSQSSTTSRRNDESTPRPTPTTTYVSTSTFRQRTRARRPSTTNSPETSASTQSLVRTRAPNRKINVNRGKLNFKVMNTEEVAEEENYPAPFLQAQKLRTTEHKRPQKTNKYNDQASLSSSTTVKEVRQPQHSDTLRVTPLSLRPASDSQNPGFMEQVYSEMAHIGEYFNDESTPTATSEITRKKPVLDKTKAPKSEANSKRGYWRKVRVRPTDVLESAESQRINSASPNQLDLGKAKKVRPHAEYDDEDNEHNEETERPFPVMPEEYKLMKELHYDVPKIISTSTPSQLETTIDDNSRTSTKTTTISLVKQPEVIENEGKEEKEEHELTTLAKTELETLENLETSSTTVLVHQTVTQPIPTSVTQPEMTTVKITTTTAPSDAVALDHEQQSEGTTEHVNSDAQIAHEFDTEVAELATTTVIAELDEKSTSDNDTSALTDVWNELRHVFTSPEQTDSVEPAAAELKESTTSSSPDQSVSDSVNTVNARNSSVNRHYPQLRTSTSTEISQETEICFRGRCVKSTGLKDESST